MDFIGFVALDIAHHGADHTVAVLEEGLDPGGGGNRRAIMGGGSADSHRVTGIVDLGVVVEDSSDQARPLESGYQLECLLAAQVAMAGKLLATGERHEVIEEHAGAVVGPLPDATSERDEEGDRAHEVRRDRGGVQTAFLERLVHQREIHLLEVAQATVHEFGGTTGRAGGEVALLDKTDGEPAGRGIEGATDAGDTAADDQHVEFALGHAFEVAPALLGVEGTGFGGHLHASVCSGPEQGDANAEFRQHLGKGRRRRARRGRCCTRLRLALLEGV